MANSNETTSKSCTRKSQNRYLLFENCKSLNDQLKFTSYKNQTQPIHENIKKFTKVAILKTPSLNSTTDLRLFEAEFSTQLTKLKEHYDSLKENLTLGFQISSKLSIKLGYEYFYSRLFRWNIDNITIQELAGLIAGNVLNTNQLYYKPQADNNSGNRKPNPNYQLIKTSFTDHCSVKSDLNRFYAGLADMSFVTDEESVVYYRVIYKNTRKLTDELYLNSDVYNNELIKNLFANNDEFELKFDKNLTLVGLNLSRSGTDCMQSVLDLMRTNDKFDIRFQTKQSLMVDLSQSIDNDLSVNLKRLFENFIKINDENNNVILGCDSEMISFLRKEEIRKYSQEMQHELIGFELNVINYDEYRVLTTLPDKKVIYESNVHVDNYVTMTSNLNGVFENENVASEDYLERLTNRIWSLGVWLSNCASHEI
jgi:hypothetical protein